jgi:hypothetical protein
VKRRSVLLRGFVAGISALVFSSTGWLMGTKSLSMPGTGTWSPGFVEEDCSQFGTTCSCLVDIRSYCDWYNGCPPGQATQCYQWDLKEAHCCMNPYDACEFWTRSFACGSCTNASGLPGTCA